MRTFSEFVEQRDAVSNNFNRCVEQVIFESQQNESLHKLLDEAGFFGNLWNAAKQFGQGVVGGGKAAWSQMTGPLAQMQSAAAALEKALSQIQSDPTWNKSVTTGDPASGFPTMPLPEWLGKISKTIRTQISQFSNKQVQPPTGTTAVGAPGSVPGPAGAPITVP